VQFNLATVFFLLPSLIAVLVFRARKMPWEKVRLFLGWQLGKPIYYLWVAGLVLVTAVPVVLLALFVYPDVYRYPSAGTTLYYYSRLGFSLFAVLGAFLYEFFYTALGEEVFFRGLLGGWLVRRCGFPLGNTLQTLIFLLPHLTILLFSPALWPLLIFPALLGWLNGWLRYRSDSIVPGMFVHALGNTLSDVLAMLHV
jgi:uncharacterized protein